MKYGHFKDEINLIIRKTFCKQTGQNIKFFIKNCNKQIIKNTCTILMEKKKHLILATVTTRQYTKSSESSKLFVLPCDTSTCALQKKNLMQLKQ